MKVTEYIAERVAPGLESVYEIDGTCLRLQTPHQDVLIARTRRFGKALFVDGALQSTESDEFLYHQSLVWPAASALPPRSRVLIIGGGESAVLREIVRFPSVSAVELVDIDPVLIAHCEAHFLPAPPIPPEIDFHFSPSDIIDYLRGPTGRFHLIISDLPSPEDSPTIASHYEDDLLSTLASRLERGGMLVTHLGAALGPSSWPGRLLARLRSAGLHVLPYTRCIPSFGQWLFCIAAHDPALISKIAAGRTLPGLSAVVGPSPMDPSTHTHMFSLPAEVAASLGSFSEEVPPPAPAAVADARHSLGSHCSAELVVPDPSILRRADRLRAALEGSARAAGLIVIDAVSHQFTPEGATCVLLLQESHVAAHTWPEHCLASVDVFTCGVADPRHVALALARELGASELTLRTHRITGSPRTAATAS